MTSAQPARQGQVDRLKQRAQRFFQAAVDAAVEETWAETKRLELGSMSVEDLYELMGHALEQARARHAGL
jgi:hypothetical protein